MREILFVFVLANVAVMHLYLLFKENKRYGVNLHSAAMFTMFIYLELVPALFFVGFGEHVQNSYKHFVEMITGCSYYQFFLAEISIILFTFFFHLAYKQKHRRSNQLNKEFDELKFLDITKFMAWVCFWVGGISFVIYIRAFGSISSMLSYAEYFRTFRTNNADIIGNASLILLIPARLVIVAPILLYTIIVYDSQRKLIRHAAFFISLFFSAIFLLFNAGKTNFIIMALCFVIPFLGKRTKYPWFIAITCGLLFLPMLGLLDSLFTYIANGTWKDFSNEAGSYLGQFAYVYGNVVNLDQVVSISGLRFGSDFITGVLNILPGVNFSASYEITSQLHFGPNWMQIAGVPIDIVTFSYLQLGLIGVISIAILFGFICGAMDQLFKQMDKEKSGVILTTVLLGIYSFFINADIGVLVKSQFQLTICAMCILYSFSDSHGKHKRIKLVLGKRTQR